MVWIKEYDNGIIINLHVIPNAKKNEIVGEHNNKLKIKIISPPVEGSANKEIIKFLSKKLKINKSKITILAGEKNREKRISLENINKEEFYKIFGGNENANL